jgi:glycine cleavage system H protein
VDSVAAPQRLSDHLHQETDDMVPTDLRYHKEHEWIRVQGNRATLGISHFAQDALGDIVFIDMPKIGAAVKAGQQIGEVESTKTTSTIYTPVSGRIVQINEDLSRHPELVNADPYGKGWMAIIELSTPTEVDGLMTGPQYQSFLSSHKT